jgi:hypothetical protein
MSSSLDIFIQQSATFSQDFDLTDSDGQALDLSSYTGKSQMRKDPEATTAYEFGVSLDEANSILTISMSAANTALISPGKYLYDVLIMTSGNTVVHRVISGVATVTPDITKVT